jgi:hypothetical protein
MIFRRVARALDTPLVGCCFLAIASALCVGWALAMPMRYGDLGWQRWIGHVILTTHQIPTHLGAETFTAPGAPWIPQEWLFAVAVSLAGGGWGQTLFAILIGLCIAATIGLTAYRTWQRSQSALSLSMSVVLATMLLFPFDSLRAEYPAWFFLALSLAVIEAPFRGKWSVMARLLLLPLAVLWANIHASVILLPTILLLSSIAAIARARAFKPRGAFHLLLAIGTLACSWINPVGYRLTTYTLGMQGDSVATRYITEWRPPTLSSHYFTIDFLPAFTLALAALLYRRKLWDLALVAPFGYLAFHAVRHIPLFAIVAVPIAATAFMRAGARLPQGKLEPRTLVRYAAVCVGAYVIASIVIGFATISANKAIADSTYEPAVDAALTIAGEHRVYCEDFSWCSLIVGFPRFTVWWDGRADPYPLAVWKSARAVAYDQPRGTAIRELDRYGVDVVIDHRGAPLNLALAGGKWRLVDAVAGDYLVWQRAAPAMHASFFTTAPELASTR